jgi:hypothetical protein
VPEEVQDLVHKDHFFPIEGAQVERGKADAIPVM